MHLSELRIRNFRCLAEVQIRLGAGLNLITGDNASGKSSLLEAVYFLGRAQSFRGTPNEQLIRNGEPGLSVSGRLCNGAGLETPIAVQRSAKRNHIRIGAQDDASILELVATLPIQVIDPRLHQLLEDGPEQRRRFLDWGVFHVEHTFYPAWLNYQRALRQRNRALRIPLPAAQIGAWDTELVQAACVIDQARRQYLTDLGAVLPDIMGRLFEAAAVTLEYEPGWPEEQSLAQTLAQSMARDRQQGFTQAGPHRADLRIRLHGQHARRRASRGEQKLISAGLLLTQAEQLRRHQAKRPILLIDDLAAELDARSRERLFTAIDQLGTQTLVSFLEAGQIPGGRGSGTMFHVEHGRVQPVT